MTQPWHRALGLALTGEDLDLGVQERCDAHAVAAALAGAGWAAPRIAAHARALAGVAPWPHPVPAQDRAGIGAAEFHAALIRTREALGVDALEVLPPSSRTTLDADERRLVADVPPHFGRT